MESPSIERPLTIEQAATQLGVSRAHLYNLIRRGDFPVVRLGALTRVSAPAVQAFIAAGGTPRRPAPVKSAE